MWRLDDGLGRVPVSPRCVHARVDQTESFTTLACHIHVQTDECGELTTVNLAAVQMTCERFGSRFQPLTEIRQSEATTDWGRAQDYV